MRARPVDPETVSVWVAAMLRAINGDKRALSRCLDRLVAPLKTVDVPELETILRAWSRACWIVDCERKAEAREKAAGATSAKPTPRRRRRGKKRG